MTSQLCAGRCLALQWGEGSQLSTSEESSALPVAWPSLHICQEADKIKTIWVHLGSSIAALKQGSNTGNRAIARCEPGRGCGLPPDGGQGESITTGQVSCSRTGAPPPPPQEVGKANVPGDPHQEGAQALQ